MLIPGFVGNNTHLAYMLYVCLKHAQLCLFPSSKVAAIAPSMQTGHSSRGEVLLLIGSCYAAEQGIKSNCLVKWSAHGKSG